MIKFVNPGDLYLVWADRPWHVQGELFVIYPWKPHFDPYVEEIKYVDLWVRIPTEQECQGLASDKIGR